MADRSTAAALGARNAVQSVDEILAELDRLAATDQHESDFYASVAARLATFGCHSAAIWLIDGDRQAELVWRAGTVGEDSANGVPPESVSSAVEAAVEASQPRTLDLPASGNGALPGSQRSIIAPWSPANIVQGALQVWIGDQASSALLAGQLQVLAAAGELIAAFLARQEHRRLRTQLDRQSQLDAFIRGLHETLDLDKLAYTIANDGRFLLGCERVSVAIRRGSNYKIMAVSGADQVHRRSDSISRLARLANAALASNDPLWLDNTSADLNALHLPPQINQSLSTYLDVSPATALAILPLRSPGHPQSGSAPRDVPKAALGALILENFTAPFDPNLRDLSRPVCDHVRLALATARRVSAIPGHRFWLSIAREGWLSRWAVQAMLFAILLAALTAALFGIQTDVRIKARGELQPVTRQHIFAPRDGIVTAVHVDHGQKVAVGETLLEMRSPELDLEIQRVAGELETVRKRLAAAQSERLQTRTTDTESRLRQRRLTAEEEQFQQQVRDLTDRQNMLAKQKEELVVKSPIAGEVITWNVEQQLASRPLSRGDELLTVADVRGAWQLELKVPSRRAGRLLASRLAPASTPGSIEQKVTFMLATDPGTPLQGSLREIAPRLETDESGESYLLAKVDLPLEATKNPTPGATAFAQITCGRGTLAEAWFHDLYDAALLWLPF